MLQKIQPARRFAGRPKIPGDKSISHRGLIFGALAHGRTEIVNVLQSVDIQSTIHCLRQLGVQIDSGVDKIHVEGLGSQGFKSPTSPLACGNSGTTMRLLMGALAGDAITATLTGDASLRRRPMHRVAKPLALMGAQVQLTQNDYAPLTMVGSPLHGIDYVLDIASAQVKTALMLAALKAQGTTQLSGQIHSRDHSERLLPYFGVDMQVTATHIVIAGNQSLQSQRLFVPGDLSAAAYWLTGASLIANAHIEIEHISLNPSRTGLLRALQRMGAKISTQVMLDKPEPLGQLLSKPASLCGIDIAAAEVPALIDELPLLAVLASQAVGVTHVAGAQELRFKESDRLQAVASNLRAMGAHIDVHQDGFTITGPQRLKGAVVKSFGDHRIAMAMAIAGLVATGETTIEGADCVNISYPTFFTTLRELTDAR